MDEKSSEAQLNFLLPQHEFFHQYFVIADSESQLFRENSRGLSGGSFLLATLLNRKDVKSKKGKDSIDSFKDFFLLKADGTFNNFFLHKFKLNPLIDNTPTLLKNASREKKQDYIYNMVADALKDLLPHFKHATFTSDMLMDFPLVKGRKGGSQVDCWEDSKNEKLGDMHSIDKDLVLSTVGQIQSTVNKTSLKEFMIQVSRPVSSSRKINEYTCSLCSFQTRYEAVCISHIENCIKKLTLNSENSVVANVENFMNYDNLDVIENVEDITCENNGTVKETADMYWNYKSCEFMLDSLYAITTVYERFGDGLGCFIVSKMLLPIFHGLNHSNYTGSIHRFVSRVLCEATPKEGLKLIHERFCNRSGRKGGNIFKDRRMEHRIRTLKSGIGNLGPNFDAEHVQRVNMLAAEKEKLFVHARKSHGVEIRSGKHVARDDCEDYRTMLMFLRDNEAQLKKPGRSFGSFDLPEDLFDYFDQAKFYRWLAVKNEEAIDILESKQRG